MKLFRENDNEGAFWKIKIKWKSFENFFENEEKRDRVFPCVDVSRDSLE